MEDTPLSTLASFIEVPPASHFPIQNLPFGVFRPAAGSAPRVGVALGEFVIDLAVLDEAGVLREGVGGRGYFARSSLNAFLAAGRPVWRATRQALIGLLCHDAPRLRDDAGLREAAVVPQSRVEMLLPAEVGDYTDFYSSREHATNVGMMFRGAANALQPNWLYLPVGYHGRASSLITSGIDVRRPWGQVCPDESQPPQLAPSQLMDFELEVGFLVGPGNRLGEPIAIADAAEHIFGFVLVNDWSARDIQKWEYVPLGPFLGKSFATSVSPWVVTVEALEPFRCAGPPQDPPPLPYLRTTENWAFDVHLEVLLQTAQMTAPERIVATNFKYLYWNAAQQLAHHTVNGCNLRPGDLLASGTISGPEPSSRGCLLELAWRGQEPITLSTGETRAFLADGDRVVMTGWAQGKGYRVGFGELSGRLLPAVHRERSTS
jgi:fumarylacetoacetase